MDDARNCFMPEIELRHSDNLCYWFDNIIIGYNKSLTLIATDGGGGSISLEKT